MNEHARPMTELLSGLLKRSHENSTRVVNSTQIPGEAYGWAARDGSPAAGEGVADQANPSPVTSYGFGHLTGTLSAALLAANGYNDAIVALLDAGGLVFGPAALARNTVEHTGLVWDLLQPGLTLQNRIARAYLHHAVGLDAEGRAAGLDDDRKNTALQRLLDSYAQAAPGAPRPPVATRYLPLKTLGGQQLSSISMQARAQPGVSEEDYTFLSTRTHPLVATLHARTIHQDGLVRAASSPAELLEVVRIAASAVRRATHTVGTHLGATTDLDALWSDDVTRTLDAADATRSR